jgi:nucleoid DNA-binding protein
MNGAQLADALAARLGISRSASRAYLETLTDELAGALARDERVVLRGFGVLEPQRRAARKVRHPGTGQPAMVPAGRSVAFRPGRQLRAALNPALDRSGGPPAE